MKNSNKEQITIRPEVLWFAEQMEITLRKNDHKGGWSEDKCSMNYLHERLHEELGELTYATGLSGQGTKEKIIEECTDVANFAMMIADRILSQINPEGDEK